MSAILSKNIRKGLYLLKNNRLLKEELEISGPDLFVH